MKKIEEILVKKLFCTRCKKKWWPRLLDRLPKKCPGCNSPYWNKKKTKFDKKKVKALGIKIE